MDFLKDLLETSAKKQLVENPAAEARFEELKQALTEREEEILQLLEAMQDKVREGKFDEVIHDSRDLVSLANKANDLLNKLPKVK